MRALSQRNEYGDGARLDRLHRAELRRDEQAVGAHAAPGPQSGAGTAGGGEEGTAHPGGNEPRQAESVGEHRLQLLQQGGREGGKGRRGWGRGWGREGEGERKGKA